MPRPGLLFVSPRFLFPMDQGGKIRTGNILKGLKNGAFQVTLASPAPADAARHQVEIDAACDRFLSWPEAPYSRVRRLAALASALPVAAATDRSASGRRVIADALAERPAVVVADFPHADVLMPNRIEPASLMFTHNVEAEIFERHAQRARGIWKLLWADQARKMARLEQAALARYDSVIAVSTRDRDVLAKRYGLAAVADIDTGVDLDFFQAHAPGAAEDPGSDGGTLVFVATMSWAANVEGIHFLLDEVWPRLLAVRPRVKAVIIGRNPPSSLSDKVRERGLAVTLTGFVDDIRPYVAKANVYVIPLFVGSGTRIKAFEAMAMGRPVVSTTLGIEGLDVTDGENFVRADNAEEFATAILGLLDDPAARNRIAGAARRLMEERFSWSTVARQFEAICLRALQRKRDHG
ncbi:glycosyltransferase [Rhodopila sp.]|uniref:glycosyltransferase n=1 Tax=Rhodopila sp. TaxID=2480087 RepID=UPI002BD571AA|nr:glycosyltransferase [Rhodopila sp.]HVZ08626.1 glycosyltransferase [Rhodopila sp.]